jgi:hypothetical protein
MKLLVMQFSPPSRHFIHLGSKYSSQHPILRHPQSILNLKGSDDGVTLKVTGFVDAFRSGL